MKSFVVVLSLLFAVAANAAQIGVPFSPEADQRFDIIENANSKIVMPQGSLKGEVGHSGNSFVSHHAKAIVSVVNGTGTYSTPIVLPPGAIVERAYALVDTQLVGATSTLAWQCNVANDILSAAAETGVAVGGIISGIPVGSPASMVYSSAGCTLKYVIGTAALTAGKLEFFVDYVVAK